MRIRTIVVFAVTLTAVLTGLNFLLDNVSSLPTFEDTSTPTPQQVAIFGGYCDLGSPANP